MASQTFQVAFRQQQAEFRRTSATISEGARQPSDEKGKQYPYLLAHGYELENLIPSLRPDDRATAFLQSRRIKWWKARACGDDRDGNTPTRNMASSQVSCINFLLPLAAIDGALETILKAIDPEVQAVETIAYDGQSSPVEFEWIGLGKSLEGTSSRGSKSTSTDALLVGRLADGAKRAYLIEWKCCEEYRHAGNKGDGESGKTRRSRYAPLYEAASSSFSGAVPMDALMFDPHYQLMRFFMLGDRMVSEQELGVRDFMVVVVCPGQNTAYRNTVTSPGLRDKFPEARTVREAMRAVLRRPDSFHVVSQAVLVEAVRRSPVAAAARDWCDYHTQRYGW